MVKANDFSLSTFKDEASKPISLSRELVTIFLCHKLVNNDYPFTQVSICEDISKYQLSISRTGFWNSVKELRENGLVNVWYQKPKDTSTKPKQEVSLKHNLSSSEVDLLNGIANLWPAVVRKYCPRNFFLKYSRDLNDYVNTELMSYLYQHNIHLESDVLMNVVNLGYRYLSDPNSETDNWTINFQKIMQNRYNKIFVHIQSLLENEKVVILS